ncbi:MAG: AIR synthase related protein, partial [bacterium]|nr:AIR synthase related protein [bacterium]
MRNGLTANEIEAMSSVSKNKGVGRQFATSIGLTYDEWDLICGLLGRTANEYEALFFAVLWGEEISRKSTQAFFHRARRMSEEQSLKYRPGRGAQRVLGDRVLAYATSGDSRFSYLDPALGVRILLQQSLLDLATMGAAPLGFSQLIRSGYPDRTDNQIFLRDLFSGVEFFSQSTGAPLVDVDLEFEKDFDAGVFVSSYFFGWGRDASLKD